jgi:hypothetical protein
MKTFLHCLSSRGTKTTHDRAVACSVGLSAAVLLLTAPALADTAVLPATGTNVTPEESEAIGMLLTDAYASASKERTLDPTVTGPALAEQGDAGKAATSLNASEYIAVRIVKLDELYTITATRYTAAGALVHSARITARSLDDAVPATDRLAKALHDRTDVAQAMTLDNVTAKETQTPNRVKTETIAGVKTGFTYAVASGTRIAPMLTLSYDGRHEASNYFVEWGIGFTVPSTEKDEDEEQYGGLHAEFGLSYYLTHTSTSPYVGGGVLPRILSGGISLAPYVQGGVMFLRHSSTRIYTDLRIAQHVMPQDFGRDYDPVTGLSERHNKYPTEFTLSLGVGF